MVFKIEDTLIKEQESLSVAEMQPIDLSRFYLAQKQCQGRIYPQPLEALSAISAALGFSARFDHKNISQAYFEFAQEQAFALLEMKKSTRPTDIGLRYSKENWYCLTKVSERGLPKPLCRLEFEMIGISEPHLELIAKQLGLTLETIQNAYLRINLKNNTFVLIAEESEIETFPD